MSEMAKSARAAMKAKAARMGGKGEPKTKVDASSWTPPEMMNTGAKVGMRPISRRAFRKGGKVIEKCEGGPAKMRADRKQRKAGGRSLVTDLINRNDKKANLAREGGGAHVGGYKRGGDVDQDKKLVKKAFAQHDKNMHGGKHEELKLRKGGRTRKQVGGSMERNAANRRINDSLEDSGTDLQREVLMSRGRKSPYSTPLIPRKTEPNYAAERDLQRGDYDAAPPMSSSSGRGPETGYKKGGKAKKGGRTKKAAGGTPPPPADSAPEPKYEDWRTLQTGKGPAPGQGDKTSPPGGSMMPKKAKGGGTYFGGTRPTGGRMPKADGGRSDEGGDYWTYKALSKTPELEEAVKAKAIHPKTTEDDWAKLSPGMRREILRSAQRKGRKSGGRAKGKTNIVISINAGKPQDQQQAMMPKMPTPPPMMPPPIAPPGMGSGMPPMMPPPIAPPGLAGAGGPPPGMPPLPRKRGGRTYRSYKDMDAGALSGMGRLEKTEIEHGKRVGRLSGGRARSYKDMDAGSLGGMGRIEKIAIQKHKR